MKLKIISSICLFLWSMTVFAQEVETEIEGAIKIGNYTGDTTMLPAGVLRWNKLDSVFQGWNGSNWRSLTNLLDLKTGVIPPLPDTLPPATSAPSSPLDNRAWTEGPLWSIDGNYGSTVYNIPVARMGTTDYFPVAFITNNTEWMRMREDGDITIKRSVYLNTEQPGSQTFNNGAFTVANMSPTFLTGKLKVDKRTQLNASLEVFGPTKINSTLLVKNQGLTLFPSEFKGAVKISDLTQSDGTVEIGTYPDPVKVVIDAGKGALVVDGGAGIAKNFNVGGDFAVQGSAAFGGSVDFYNPLSVKASEESETLWVGDSITGALRVYGGTGIRGKLNVGNNFSVRKSPVTVPYVPTTDPIDVFKVDATKGQVTITSIAPITPDDRNYNNYPLRIEGGNQGIAIKVNGSRSNKNNFVSFWDETNNGTMWGRIEGEIPSEFNNNADHVFNTKNLAYSEFDAGIALGFAIQDLAIAVIQVAMTPTDIRTCTGFPVNCATLPGPADIAFSIAEVASDAVQLGFAEFNLFRAIGVTKIYNTNKDQLQGVTYASGAGDYAEYLKRAKENEDIYPGEIVGIVGGTVSKNTSTAESMAVVSSHPIVLGNMPQPGNEDNFEKIAFIGQVPVKIFGKVEIGDYIVPGGNNDGIGKAIHPSNITAKDLKNIVGVAWTENKSIFGYNEVLVSVGLNSNDGNPIVGKLEKQIEELDVEILELEESLSILHQFIQNVRDGSTSNSFESKKMEERSSQISHSRNDENLSTDQREVTSWEITEEDFEDALNFLEDVYQENNLDFDNNIVFQQIKNDLNYKTQMFEIVKKRMQESFLDHQEEYHNVLKH